MTNNQEKELKKKILELLSTEKFTSTNEISNKLNINWHACFSLLHELMVEGYVEKTKTNKEILWKKKNERMD